MSTCKMRREKTEASHGAIWYKGPAKWSLVGGDISKVNHWTSDEKDATKCNIEDAIDIIDELIYRHPIELVKCEPDKPDEIWLVELNGFEKDTQLTRGIAFVSKVIALTYAPKCNPVRYIRAD